jgi:deoxyribonuclease-4
MSGVFFGPAGIPGSAKGKKPEEGVREVKRLGLDCMELEFVRGVRMSENSAAAVRSAAKETGVRLTAHGPYYINLCSKEREKVSASIERVLATARVGFLCGAESITFHAAFYQGRDEREIFSEVSARLKSILAVLSKEKIKMEVRPELTGKPSQFGSLEELIEISRKVKGVLPCIDFAHLFARTNGRYNSYDAFCEVLEALKKGLGPRILKNMHMHISGIEFTAKGERKHLELEKSRFKWKDLLRALVDYKVEGICICESPTLEKDALILKKTYQALARKR